MQLYNTYRLYVKKYNLSVQFLLTSAKCGMDTDKKRVEQPREKWIVVEGQHEALVSQEVFKKANDNLVGLDVSGRNTGVRNLFFVCGYCGKGLRFPAGRRKSISAGAGRRRRRMTARGWRSAGKRLRMQCWSR